MYAGAGAYAGCCYCCVKGEYSHCLTKMVYLGHRRYLLEGDLLRTDNKNFPHKFDHPSPPKLKDMEYVDTTNAEYSAATIPSEQKKVAQKSGCKGPYSLRRLPGHDRFNTPVDPMHLIKNIEVT